MGLDFSRTSTQQPVTAPEVKNEIEVVEQYDIVADREQMNAELVNSPEVDALVSTIEIDNMETIVSFGAKAAEEISNPLSRSLRSARFFIMYSAMGDLQMFPWQTKINFIAEAAGFEPASRFCPANCFRGSLLQPLGHASFVSNQGKNTSIGINSKIYERKMRKIVRLSTASWRLPHKSMP